MTELKIRKALPGDLDTIMRIYRNAQEFMISVGNPTQWGHFYPEEDMITEDIEKGISLVIYDDSGVHGVLALCEGDEPSYQYIEGGKWLNNESYVTVHRIAGDGVVHGVFDCAIGYCKEAYDNIRIDTHDDNKIMQKLITRSGFQRCGTIYVFDGTPRIAYHWTKPRTAT